MSANAIALERKNVDMGVFRLDVQILPLFKTLKKRADILSICMNKGNKFFE